MQPARPACPPSCIVHSSCRLIFRPWLLPLLPGVQRRRRRQRQRSRKYCNAHCLSRMEQATGSQAHAAQWPAKRPLSPSARSLARLFARHVFSAKLGCACSRRRGATGGRAKNKSSPCGVCFLLPAHLTFKQAALARERERERVINFSWRVHPINLPGRVTCR